MSYQSIYDRHAVQEANDFMQGQTWDTTYASPESAEMIHNPTGHRYIIHWFQETDNWTGRLVYRMDHLVEYDHDHRPTLHDLSTEDLEQWFDPDYRTYDELIDAAQDMTEYIISNA